MAKQRLGKGLDALIPELPQIRERGVQEIPVIDIIPNRKQPRQQFDTEKLHQLAESISKHGIVQPVALRKIDKGFELIAGERRWRAARMADIKTIPAVIMELNEQQMMEVALVENLQREDLNPLEEAEAYKTLMEEHGLTQEQVSEAVGKSRPAVTNSLRLLNLDSHVQELVRQNKITAGHARALATLHHKTQSEVAQRIISDGLNVRETEKLINKINRKNDERPNKQREKKPWMVEMESSMGEILGTKVQIVHGKRKGRIEIEYYNNEDLERILQIING